MSKTTDSISSTCVLCCGGIKYFAVGPCNHHICLKCSTRMRVLCQQKYCAVCRAEMPKVIATAKLHPYNGIIAHKFPMERKAGIAFATSKIQDEYRRLLWDVCQFCTLRAPERTFKDLQDHMRKEHELFYCDLCIKHLKVFSFERKTYSRKDLALHRRKGDGKDTSYRGHPLCEFCDERYFDNDELLRHLRQQHYFCHFCETDGVSNQYYNDYDNLKVHFREQHYLCEEDRCAQEQFTHAFRSSIDLKAHRATAHSSQMSKAQARQMRQLDVEINLPPRPCDRGGGGGGPGFARGRDRRYHGHRDEDVSTAIQASMETSKQEMAGRLDARRQDRDERDNRSTKERPQDGRRQDTDERDNQSTTERPQDARRQDRDERDDRSTKERPQDARRQDRDERDNRSTKERPQDTRRQDRDERDNRSTKERPQDTRRQGRDERDNRSTKERPQDARRQDRDERDSRSTKERPQDTRRQDRDERDSRSTKERPQAKKKPTSGAQVNIGRDAARSKLENETDVGTDEVAVETAVKKPGMNEKGMRKEAGRTSPQSEGETKTQRGDDSKHSSSRSTESAEEGNGKQKVEVSLPSQSETVKEIGKKKKKGKVSADKNDNASEKESSQSSLKPEDSKMTPLDDVQREVKPISNAVNVNAKSAYQKLAWTTSEVKVEDFPALGQSTSVNASISSAAGASDFYSALQKMDTQPKPQKQPVPVPAQRSFTNKDEDFPTLSSIAGILGVDPVPSRANRSTQSNNAWTTPKDNSVNKQADAKPVAKSKKKGKKPAKETQDVVKPNLRTPPGFAASQNDAKPQGSRTVIPQRTPPGPPPGLGSNISTPPLVQPTSSAPSPSIAAPFSVGPPPGFGVSVSMTDSTVPPGFGRYVQPANFQERNLTLATKIKACLGHQEDKFDMFRSFSRRFRDGSMTAAEYYDKCRMLLGDNLPHIFTELVTLLPDIIKQQELISAQSAAKIKEKDQKNESAPHLSQTEPVKSKDKGRGSGVWKLKASSSCPQCGKEIPRLELESHLNIHQDFPSLSANAVSKQQPIAAAAPTWPRLK